MKRILLSLAAVAVLASCVKENNLASLAGQETISAVSADSKTLLDGNNVVWETTDKIAVVVNGQTQVTAEFAVVEETVNGSEADFVGATGADWSKATSAYAVYPAAAVNGTHTLPAEQNGKVSGLMLSTAVVPVADMKNGSASVEFNPALSLLNVMVPAGVKSVELTSAGSALVGEATFEVDPATGAVALTVADGATKTVSISAEEELEAKTYPVLVYPGEVGDLTLKLVGTKGEEFVKTVSNITLAVAEARAVNLMQIFEFAPEEAIEVAANGGTIELPFTTTVEEITVTEDADWLKSAVAVKGFQTGNVTLVATANEGEEARTAVVTVSWGEGKSVSFTLTQPAIYRGFLNDVDDNPIQWEETFGLYTSEDDANAANVANATATHKNVFTIELSDDYTKGTYLVSNIFKAASYYDNNGQRVSNKGGEYYANYKDGKLTLLYANAVKSYGFTTDVTIFYDETTKTFSAAPFKAYDYSASRDRYIGGYAAAVKVEEPEVGGSFDVTSLYGTYNELVSAPYSSNAPETLLVTASDDSSYDLKMLFFYTEGQTSHDTGYGKVSADGKTITVTIPGYSSFYGPVSDFTLTFEDGVISGSFCGQMDYSAENPNYVAPGAGTEPEPEPEQPTRQPNDSWENAAVAVNGPEAIDDSKVKELKVYADADYLYVRLTTVNESPFFANYLDVNFTDGEGAGEVWWGWTTTGTKIYYQEHKNEIDANGNITKMRWYTDPDTRVYVDDYTTTISDSEVVWEIKYPRNYVDVYKSSTNTIYVSALTWNDWAPYWAIPARGNAMLEVVLP